MTRNHTQTILSLQKQFLNRSCINFTIYNNKSEKFTCYKWVKKNVNDTFHANLKLAYVSDVKNMAMSQSTADLDLHQNQYFQQTTENTFSKNRCLYDHDTAHSYIRQVPHYLFTIPYIIGNYRHCNQEKISLHATQSLLSNTRSTKVLLKNQICQPQTIHNNEITTSTLHMTSNSTKVSHTLSVITPYFNQVTFNFII